jgi:hypothetical protein
MNTCRLLLLSLLAGTLLIQNASADGCVEGATGRKCATSALKEGPVPGREGLRLGKPVKFDDGVGISQGECFPLYSSDKLVTWLDSMHATGSRLFVRRCLEDASITDTPAGSKGGAIEDAYDELVASDGNDGFKFNELTPPHWSLFSNPSFCESSIAYWGTELKEKSPTKIYAVIFDLNAGKVVRKELLGTVEIESDSRGFFPRPRWDDSGTTVTFDADAAKRSVKLGLNHTTLSTK